MGLAAAAGRRHGDGERDTLLENKVKDFIRSVIRILREYFLMAAITPHKPYREEDSKNGPLTNHL